jgi:SNF2 family DNA or RNA helicase
MADADIVGNRIIVHSEGSMLIRIKSDLSRVLNPEDIIYIGKTELAFPLAYGFQAFDLLKQHTVQFSPNLEHEMGRVMAVYHNHLAARQRVLAIQEEGLALTGDNPWDGLLKPHQGIAANCMAVKGLLGLCLFDEQGTGKTLSTVATFDLLRKKQMVGVLLVIGQKTFLGNWAREFDTFLSGQYRVLLMQGDQLTKFRSLEGDWDVYLINYESVEPLLTPLKSLAKERSAMLAVDESYFVKNPDAKRSLAVKDLRTSCERGYALCGTPAPNRPSDIIHQFDIADMGFTFMGYRPSGTDARDRVDIMNRIQERGVYLRKPKSEVLPGLPKKYFKIIELEMSGKQLALYEKAKRELVLFLRNLDNSTFMRNLGTYFQKRAALLQICVSPRMIDKTYDETPAKYSALDQLVETTIAGEMKKIVIWSVYTRTLDDIEKRYRHYGLVRIDGTVTSSEERTRSVKAFQEDPSVRVFIGNPSAAGAGITLHAASDCAYLSFSNQAAHYLQSLDRIHRLGQIAPKVTYTFLVCRATIEQSELQRLSRKERSQKDMLGEPTTDEFTLETALSELED